jgi:D-alanine-D-alanine ligase-like ATP-grasp enzyme
MLLNIREDNYASYKLLAEALKQKGYTITVSKDSPVMASFTHPNGRTWQTKAANIAYPFNGERARNISDHKYLSYQLAEKTGVSFPYAVQVTDTMTDQDLEALLDTYGKVIVKPDNSSLSKGLTLNIDSLPELKQAIEYAKRISPSVLIQQQIAGEEIRFTVIDGKVESALLRRTARVIGDGESAIAALIKKENKERESLRFAYLNYPQLDDAIIDKQLLTSERIPAKNEIVELNHSTMVKGGCSVYDVLPDVHESYVPIVENFVKKLGAGFVVMDIFCEVYKKPAMPNNHWFIEFNTAPVLKLYYACRDKKQFDIVPRLVDMIDRWLTSTTD